MTYEVKHLFICLLAISISSSVKCLFLPFACFVCLFVFLIGQLSHGALRVLCRGTLLAQLVEHLTLDLGVMSSSPMSVVELT